MWEPEGKEGGPCGPFRVRRRASLLDASLLRACVGRTCGRRKEDGVTVGVGEHEVRVRGGGGRIRRRAGSGVRPRALRAYGGRARLRQSPAGGFVAVQRGECKGGSWGNMLGRGDMVVCSLRRPSSGLVAEPLLNRACHRTRGSDYLPKSTGMRFAFPLNLCE